MDPRLLKYYNRELQHLREMGGEFASEFPKIAGRLGLDSFECADPYVERLLEGFAFLAARLQLRIDAEFPQFTHHLLEIVFPHYLSPTPSMSVVQFHPELTSVPPEDGYKIPRNSALRSVLGKGETTSCEYRTAHDVVLWPIELTEAEYFSRAAASADKPIVSGAKAGVRLRLETAPGVTFDKLSLDRLPLFLRGSGDVAMRLYEQCLANLVALVVRPALRPAPWQQILPPDSVQALGFCDAESLLPYTARSFQGYRLLQEYFACPQRFMFIEATGLSRPISRCAHNALDLFLLFDRPDRLVEQYLNEQNFGLFCTPAVNLFPKAVDRIHLTDRTTDHHVVADRTRPQDFEIYRLTSVVGFGSDLEERQVFRPFYASGDHRGRTEQPAFYTTQRVPRVLSTNQRRYGPRSSYIGSEVFVTLVDADEAPYSQELRQLGVEAYCTNRDLPLHMPIGKGHTDFFIDSGGPIQSIRCLAGPTKPKPAASYGEGDVAWRLISHLSLNYLSITDCDETQGAAALRELLDLYGDASESSIRKQIEGLLSVSCRPIIRRIPTSGPMTFGRGLEILVKCDETSFEGSGVFLLGAVLDHFFARYVSINSFTETVIETVDRGQVMRWPARIGRRPTL